jgi:hypothetical protein
MSGGVAAGPARRLRKNRFVEQTIPFVHRAHKAMGGAGVAMLRRACRAVSGLPFRKKNTR